MDAGWEQTGCQVVASLHEDALSFPVVPSAALYDDDDEADDAEWKEFYLMV